MAKKYEKSVLNSVTLKNGVNPHVCAYITSKRGLGIRVVEGKRVAEQAVYNRRNDAVCKKTPHYLHNRCRLNWNPNFHKGRLKVFRRPLLRIRYNSCFAYLEFLCT